ncbi:unnamed protein product [Pylaiella littoralis]
MKIFGASSRNRSWAGVQQHRTGKASLALLVMSLLGSEYHTSPCSAFVLSVVTAPSSVPGSLAAAAGNLSPSLTAVRRRDSNRVSSSSCGPAAAATAAAGVPPLGRPYSALAASNNNGADDDASVSVGTGPSGSSADVFEALMAGDMAFVTEYVQSGGDCNIQDSIGDTPLMLAVESELASAVRLLITEGRADVNRASETTGETPLMLASYYGHTNLARVLVAEGGADLEARNKKGDTALGLACYWGNEDAVEYLLEAGADPNSRNDAGERPGDKFDDVFVPSVVGNFFTADDEDKKDGGEEKETKKSEDKITFDDDGEEDIMFDELDVKPEEAAAAAASEKEDVTLEEEKGGDGEPNDDDEEQLQGPREVILDMLERAREEAAALKAA